MSIQLLETSEEDCFVLVAQHIGNLLNDGQARTALAETPGSRFIEDCQILLQEDRFEDFLTKVIPHVDLLFRKSTGQDAESSVSILLHTMQRLSTEASSDLAGLMTIKISQGDDKPEERLNSLLNLYAVLSSDPAAQFGALLAAIKFATKSSKLAVSLSPMLRGRADVFVTALGLNEVQCLDLYLAMAGLQKLTHDKAGAKENLKLITQALKLVKSDDVSVLASVTEAATTAIADVIRSPTTVSADLADLPAVEQLSSDPKTAGVHKLFMAMMFGDLAACRAAMTPEALESVKMTSEAGLSKARLMALLGLCSRIGVSSVSFEEIRTALDIPNESVESWVIKAVGGRMLECKIDQVGESVTISRSTHRTFGMAEWRVLRDQLGAWRDAMASVSTSLAQVRPPTPLAAYRAPAAIRS